MSGTGYTSTNRYNFHPKDAKGRTIALTGFYEEE